ncbi:hypothetical protein D3C77_205000 [compost metagenome]
MDTVDYSAMFTGVVDEALGGVAAGTPLGLKIGAVVLGIGIVWKLIRRFAKA